MMQTVGVRDLKAHLSEFLHQVQETGEVIEVTNHGEVIARLVPARNTNLAALRQSSVWTDLDRLSAELGALNPEPVDSVQLVNEIRREL